MEMKKRGSPKGFVILGAIWGFLSTIGYFLTVFAQAVNNGGIGILQNLIFLPASLWFAISSKLFVVAPDNLTVLIWAFIGPPILIGAILGFLFFIFLGMLGGGKKL